ALLFVAFVACQFGFTARAEHLGPGKEVLDSQRWYSPRQAHELLKNLGEEGRQLYAITEVTLDLIFPVVYAALFAGLLGNLYRARVVRRLAPVPLLAAAADWCENVCAALLAWTFTEDADWGAKPIAWGAVIATPVKEALFLASMALVA